MTKRHKINTVVIVEDDIDNRKFLSRLISLEGLVTFETENGDIGLELVRRHKTALVLLDLTLSKHDGWSVLREIKQAPELNGIPVIVFTALAEAEYRQKALSMGADAYLVKPISADDLGEAVAHILHHNK